MPSQGVIYATANKDGGTHIFLIDYEFCIASVVLSMWHSPFERLEMGMVDLVVKKSIKEINIRESRRKTLG